MRHLFFFQAEDGIRDIGVTGVQTCALPICPRPRPRCESPEILSGPVATGGALAVDVAAVVVDVAPQLPALLGRSEERRGGKECRSPWAPDPLKKKTWKR